MNIGLWERNLNVMRIQCVIDHFAHFIENDNFFRHTHPARNIQIDAAFSKIHKENRDPTSLVNPSIAFVFELFDKLQYCINDYALCFMNICTLSYTNRQRCQFPAMIARKVFVVFSKKL